MWPLLRVLPPARCFTSWKPPQSFEAGGSDSNPAEEETEAQKGPRNSGQFSHQGFTGGAGIQTQAWLMEADILSTLLGSATT